jgi:transcriptional regulator with XRE-family HTH domain
MNKMDLQRAFGQNLKKYRLKSKRSQEQIALAGNTSPTHIGELERGERCPSLDTIFKLSKILGVTPSQLLDFDTDYYTNTEAHIIIAELLSSVPDNAKLKLACIFRTLVELYKDEISLHK